MSNLIRQFAIKNPNSFSKRLVDLLNVTDPSQNFSGISTYSYSETMAALVDENHDSTSLKLQIVMELLNGKVLIFRGAMSSELIAEVYDACAVLQTRGPSISHQATSLCDDMYSVSNKCEGVGYNCIDRSYYFFPWNVSSPVSIFNKVSEIAILPIILSGFQANHFRINVPADRYIERVHVINYPDRAGLISQHVDPFNSLIANCGLYMTQYGEDYVEGGFFCGTAGGEKLYVDHEVKKGDMVLFFPGLKHGVDPVREIKSSENKLACGRWFLNYNVVESHLFPDRMRALPI
jgi:hypothetical protein